MADTQSRTVDPENPTKDDYADPQVKAALDTYNSIKKNALENSYVLPGGAPMTWDEYLGRPDLELLIYRELLKSGVVFDVADHTICFAGDEYYNTFWGKSFTFQDLLEAELKALPDIFLIPETVAVIGRGGSQGRARQEVIYGLTQTRDALINNERADAVKEKRDPRFGAIILSSAFRPLGQTVSEAGQKDPHGVADTNDPQLIGHWTGWAIDVGWRVYQNFGKADRDFENSKEGYLERDDIVYPILGNWFVQNLGKQKEAMHWVRIDANPDSYYGGLLSEKGVKRARATMSSALGSPGDDGRALGFLPAGGLGGSGLGPAAALAGALSRRGSGAGSAAAPGGPGEGVNFKQYIDKVNVTSYGGFNADALMAALEEAAQQGTAKVG